jgi:hypothetical protein
MGKGKQTMGKDRSGTFHPGKGKPSGINKEEGLGMQPTPPEKMDQYHDITEKYTDGEDELTPDVPLRHPNRNTSKGEETYKGKENNEASNKSKNEHFAEPLTDTVPVELPELMSREIIAQLAEYKSDCCISIYLTTHQSGMEVNEHYDSIHFKNALQKVTKQLEEKGYEESIIKQLLKPGYDLIRDDAFWVQQAKGLAVFISDGYFRYLRMRYQPMEKIMVNKSFYISPLVSLLVSPEYFYLLVISKHQGKLFRADAYGMSEVPVENLPQAEGTAESLEDEEGRSNDNVFYGISGSKTNTATYFKAINDILKEAVLKNEHVPLLLAGVESVVAIYRSVCDYNYVWKEALTGSHEHEDINILYPQARAIMQPYFNQRLNKALELYANQSATPLTSSIAADVIPAAHYGRISHLFIAKGEHMWGTFDEMNNELKVEGRETANNEDLVDKTVVKTLVTGGEVFMLEKEKMPAFSSIAAVMRY